MKIEEIGKYILSKLVKARIWLNNKGYPVAILFGKIVYIHRLIYLLFKGKIRKGNVIHHKDSNKLNFLPSNLIQVTKQEHIIIHSVRV